MKQRVRNVFWLMAGWCLAAVNTPAQETFSALKGPVGGGDGTTVELLLSDSEVRQGQKQELTAAIRMKLAPGWHTYWRNPGGPGYGAKIAWQLPAGVEAGPILWPIPERYASQGVSSYVYHDEVLLMVSLRIAPSVGGGELRLDAKVDWLECKDSCIPREAKVTGTVRLGSTTQASPNAALLDAARLRLPTAGGANSVVVRAGWESTATNDERGLILEWPVGQEASASEHDFYPFAYPQFEISVDGSELSQGDGVARVRKTVRKWEGDWPARIEGMLVAKRRDDGKVTASEVMVELPAESSVATPTIPLVQSSLGKSSTAPLADLGKMLWFGFLGGLILNVMPCVFPVIALKILGFVNQSAGQGSRHGPLRLGIVYGLGVLVSFWIMAALVLGVRAAGDGASWGMQMQNPQFTLGLTVLVMLVALNLFGVFEVNLGGTAMGAAGSAATQEGPAGAFFNGVLATVLATPCTAPFLAPALGFAFAQPAPVILAMFSTVALGLALPYVVLSAKPEWLRFLPRPGLWMERFKVAMGFPMLATAVWLFSFTARRFGPDGPLFVGLFLVVTALAAWIWGEFVQRGRRSRGIGMAAALFTAAAGYGFALESELNWRSPRSIGGTAVPTALASGGAGGIQWQPWSAMAVAQAQAQGKPVLVDFTADWCLTCKANKRTSLEMDSVRQRLREIGAVTLIGDYTEKDPLITAELQKHGRAGVPLVLVYSKAGNRPPTVLPALLTPGIVIEALAAAVGASP